MTIQNYINSISHYYSYLLNEGENPASAIQLKGIKKKSLYHILKASDLERLYSSFSPAGLPGKRNKIMLGLLVYQGLTTNELSRLEVRHLMLREGKIEVPGSGKSNGRILNLEPLQILDLHEYIFQTRTALLEASGQKTERLLVSHREGMNISNYLQEMFKALRPQHKSLVNTKQIRASVITKWLRVYNNLREVQYMAGHRYISSTESYLHNDVESLADQLNKYHPLG